MSLGNLGARAMLLNIVVAETDTARGLEAVLKEEFEGIVEVHFIEDAGKTGNFEVILLETGKLLPQRLMAARANAKVTRSEVC